MISVMNRLNNIKAVIFDWGRTLFDSDKRTEFPESERVLNYCKEKGYRLAAISLTVKGGSATLEERKRQVENSPLRGYFEIALVIFGSQQDKEKSYDEIIEHFGFLPSEILIIDDQTNRGIKYGNRHGHPTVWLKQGKFANELPTEETGQPAYTITNLKELLEIL